MKVKAIRDGYYLISRKRKGSVFELKKSSHFSHLWMRALDFSPPDPDQKIVGIMDSPEFQSKFAKYTPYDKTTHATDVGVEDPHQDVEVFDENKEPEEEAPKPNRKKPSEQQVI